MRALKRGINLEKCLLIGAPNPGALTQRPHERARKHKLHFLLAFCPHLRHYASMSQTIELPVETLARPSQAMPQWAVRLHNDNKNDMVYVVSTLVQLVRLPAKDATERTLETHNHGSAIVFQTHREHAELVRDQLQSKGLSATIEKN